MFALVTKPVSTCTNTIYWASKGSSLQKHWFLIDITYNKPYKNTTWISIMRRQLHFTRMSRLEALSNVHMITILIQFPLDSIANLGPRDSWPPYLIKQGKFPHPPTQYRRPPFLIPFQDSTVLWTLANGDPVPSRRPEYYNTIQRRSKLEAKEEYDTLLIYGYYTVTIRNTHTKTSVESILWGAGAGAPGTGSEKAPKGKNHLRSCSIRGSLLLRSLASNNGALICLICFALIAFFTKNCFILQIHALITCFPFTSCKTFHQMFWRICGPTSSGDQWPEVKEFDAGWSVESAVCLPSYQQLRWRWGFLMEKSSCSF